MIAARGSGEQPQPGPDGRGKPWHGNWKNPAAYNFRDTSYGAGEFNYYTYLILKTRTAGRGSRWTRCGTPPIRLLRR